MSKSKKLRKLNKIKIKYCLILFILAAFVGLLYNFLPTFTKYYAEIAGISIYDLNYLEFYFCVKLKFSFFVEYDIYQKYFEYFLKYNNEKNNSDK